METKRIESFIWKRYGLHTSVRALYYHKKTNCLVISYKSIQFWNIKTHKLITEMKLEEFSESGNSFPSNVEHIVGWNDKLILFVTGEQITGFNMETMKKDKVFTKFSYAYSHGHRSNSHILRILNLSQLDEKYSDKFITLHRNHELLFNSYSLGRTLRSLGQEKYVGYFYEIKLSRMHLGRFYIVSQLEQNNAQQRLRSRNFTNKAIVDYGQIQETHRITTALNTLHDEEKEYIILLSYSKRTYVKQLIFMNSMSGDVEYVVDVTAGSMHPTLTHKFLSLRSGKFIAFGGFDGWLSVVNLHYLFSQNYERMKKGDEDYHKVVVAEERIFNRKYNNLFLDIDLIDDCEEEKSVEIICCSSMGDVYLLKINNLMDNSISQPMDLDVTERVMFLHQYLNTSSFENKKMMMITIELGNMKLGEMFKCFLV